MSGTSAGHRWENVAILGSLSILLFMVYAPLARWLTRTAAAHGQLATGGLLVLIATVVSFREVREALRVQWRMSTAGIGLLAAGALVSLVARAVPGGAIPLMLLSFALSLSAVISFVYGLTGIRVFFPPLAAVIVLGTMAGAVPDLDWPLRAISARYAAGALQHFGIATELALVRHRPPVLLLGVGDRVFEVAAECNGFGLLTSALTFAAILMFRYRLRWFRKIGLIAFAVPLAVFANVARIVGICLTAVHTRLPYGLIHEGLGTLIYALALALLWGVARRAEEPPANGQAKPDGVDPEGAG